MERNSAFRVIVPPWPPPPEAISSSSRAGPSVHVYAGTVPVTGKPRRLKQTCPDEASAAAALGRLLAQADGDRFPNREATLGQALGKYLEVADLEVSTREAHEGYIRRTIGPGTGRGEDPQARRRFPRRALHGPRRSARGYVGDSRGPSTTRVASMHVMGGAARCVTTAPPAHTSATAAAVRTCVGR